MERKSMLTAIIHLFLKSFLEAVRLKTFGRCGFNQMQVSVSYYFVSCSFLFFIILYFIIFFFFLFLFLNFFIIFFCPFFLFSPPIYLA